MRLRLGLFALVGLSLLLVSLFLWRSLSRHKVQESVGANATPAKPHTKLNHSDTSPTRVFAHNLLLRKGPNFRVYVRWLNGRMVRSKPNKNPSFDDPDSFTLDITTGVLRANIGDLGNYLNTEFKDSPVSNIRLSGDGDQIKLNGTVRKVLPLPIELIATLGVAADGRVQVHVNKLNVLKVPFKGLIGVFHITVADLFKKSIEGLEIVGNDLFFDTHRLLPPPHIKGHLTKVRIDNPDLEEVFGNAQEAVDRVEQWRNFLRLQGGTLDFGKLTMNDVDLIMIDISKDPWFDLDLTNYQKQLTNGYTRVTPDSGLQIFMPDLRDIPPRKANQDTGIEWFKNRNIPPPVQITKAAH
jgi:hypothetical protein